MCALAFRKAASKYSQKHESISRNLKELQDNSKRIGISKKINSDNSIINNPLKEEKRKTTSKDINVALQGGI